MNSTTWLRISAGLTLFQAVGHTFGAVLASPSHGPEEVVLREAMRTFRMTEMGMERSYWDFYVGLGWTVTALLVAIAAVMWLLVPLVRQSPSRTRPVIAVLAAGYAAVTAISAAYFVTAPIVLAAVITACMTAAMLRARSGDNAERRR